ncbi:MAG: folate-binding protein YgfZ [Glaciecola sp.]|jgi:folate-binding protein YgfZ
MASQHELIVKLNSLGCITMSGPQAKDYLQGQVTIDVTKMTPDAARFGAHCDFKGKAWSVFTALLNNDVFHLIMRKSALEKSLSEFKKYGVFSKVDIQQANAELSFFGVSGSATVSAINSLFTDLNDQHLSVTNNEFGSAICLNRSNPRYILALNVAGAALLSKLTNADNYEDESHWEAMDVLDGIPYIEAQTSNQFVPQMLNLQAVAGIDFDKGCYMGQETVARTKFLGRNKRASYILIHQGVDISEALNPGDALEKQAGDNWRSGGTILQSAVLDDKTVVFGVLANDTQTGDVLRLKALPEHTFEVSALPYKLD